MIDIFEMAAERLHQAQERQGATPYMQASPAATPAFERARLDVEIAEQGMPRFRSVVLDLTPPFDPLLWPATSAVNSGHAAATTGASNG
jgi:hypothetical protein